jgi:hypothetical protein
MLKNNINYILISHLKTLIFRLRNSFTIIIIIKEININYFIKNSWWLYYLYIVLYIYVTITDLWRKKKKNTKRCEPSVNLRVTKKNQWQGSVFSDQLVCDSQPKIICKICAEVFCLSRTWLYTLYLLH